MNYSRAIELLGLTTPKSLKANAELAKTRIQRFTVKTPPRYKIAASVVIKAAI